MNRSGHTRGDLIYRRMRRRDTVWHTSNIQTQSSFQIPVLFYLALFFFIFFGCFYFYFYFYFLLGCGSIQLLFIDIDFTKGIEDWDIHTWRICKPHRTAHVGTAWYLSNISDGCICPMHKVWRVGPKYFGPTSSPETGSIRSQCVTLATPCQKIKPWGGCRVPSSYCPNKPGDRLTKAPSGLREQVA